MSETEHDVEQTVKVYLEWDGMAWVIDPVTIDGYPLDSDHDATCDYEGSEHDETTCPASVADEARLPDAQELLSLLADSLGYTLVKEYDTERKTDKLVSEALTRHYTERK